MCVFDYFKKIFLELRLYKQVSLKNKSKFLNTLPYSCVLVARQDQNLEALKHWFSNFLDARNPH